MRRLLVTQLLLSTSIGMKLLSPRTLRRTLGHMLLNQERPGDERSLKNDIGIKRGESGDARMRSIGEPGQSRVR